MRPPAARLRTGHGRMARSRPQRRIRAGPQRFVNANDTPARPLYGMWYQRRELSVREVLCNRLL